MFIITVPQMALASTNKTLGDNVAHLHEISLKLLLCPGEFLGSEKGDKKKKNI